MELICYLSLEKYTSNLRKASLTFPTGKGDRAAVDESAMRTFPRRNGGERRKAACG